MKGLELVVINPRHACTARVTVVVLCVCLSVCYHSSGGIVHFYAETKVRAALLRYYLDKNASFRSYGVICLSRQSPAILQQSLARFFDDRGF